MLCQLPEKADNLSKEEERGLHFGYGSGSAVEVAKYGSPLILR